ncbi:MAG: sulfatase-like hydrolase/transferase [Proteobacteria bacterium]|nr:sulfatase-like hydrolase/transferase [Pseudomonadota bacterium]
MRASERPNIILIMTDNQPADMLGCYGNPEVSTPHLDKMASEGLIFENAYCPNAMCSPSRASVWTGRMPCQHGVHTWLDDRQMENWPAAWNAIEEFDTLPEILKRNGYATAMIGKYHLGMLDAPQNGIDHWITMARGHTLDFYGNQMRVNDKTFVHEGHSVDFFTDKAVEYIGERAAAPDDPFLLMLPYNGPYGHWPSIKGPAQNRFWLQYQDMPMNSVPREAINKAAIDCYEMNKSFHPQGKGGPDFSALLQIPNDLTSLRNYYSQMSVVDDGVGRVFAALEAGGLDENTIVIFTADHGFSLGHHGFWGHGQATWPSNGFRVAYNIPLLIWSRRLLSEGPRSVYVSSTDLYATLLAYLGMTGDVDMTGVPSRDFGVFLYGDADPWDDAVVIEQEETRIIRTPEWSYFKRFKGSDAYPLEDELYDLSKDPDERVNLSGNPAQADIETALSAKIDAYFAAYADARFDLWKGGAVKSNSSRPWLWKDAWGEDWAPVT